MTARQWASIASRTSTYLPGYTDKPGSEDRAQARARWLASQAVFSEASSVLELGCACGRNLAEIQRRRPDTFVVGVDINAEAIRMAEAAIPTFRKFFIRNLYQVNDLPLLDPSLVLTVGVLGHLERSAVTSLLNWSLQRAKDAVVLVEEWGYDRLLKGPKQWGAQKNTGDYVLWAHDYEHILHRNQYGTIFSIETLPKELQAPAATHMVVLKPKR
jgi:SAM-dependent methyltransferase